MAAQFNRICRRVDGSYYIREGYAPKEEITMMVCDIDSKVIYYKPQPESAITSDFMCPYIGENGKYCRFIDNEIVEIP